MNTLKFYDVDINYTNYLKRYEPKIPNINYHTNNKFLCGIVLNIQQCNYYVPVSHITKRFKSSFIILDNGQPISSLRFSFMFPCPNQQITEKTFENYDTDKYIRLLDKELKYCNLHYQQILSKANLIYNYSKNSYNREKYNLCNFALLEQKCIEYQQNNEIKSS